MTTIELLDDQGAPRDVLGEAVRPVLAEWGIEDQADALIALLAALSRKGYSINALIEILVAIDDMLDDDDV